MCGVHGQNLCRPGGFEVCVLIVWCVSEFESVSVVCDSVCICVCVCESVCVCLCLCSWLRLYLCL